MIELTIQNLLICSLAIYKLSTDFAYEEGPFQVYKITREYVQNWVVIKADAEEFLGEVEDYHLYWVYNGIECPACISFWLSLIVGWLFLPMNILIYFIVCLTMSGITSLIERR